jgi:hypothetical protein
MIEPPKLFTDARKEYDLQDVEILGKITLELGLQMKAEIRAAFEKLVDLTGTHQFQTEYIVLHELIMNKREEILASVIYTGSTLPTMVSPEQLKKTPAISCLAPKRFPASSFAGGSSSGNLSRYHHHAHQYGYRVNHSAQTQFTTTTATAAASGQPQQSKNAISNNTSSISMPQMHLQPTLRTSPPSSVNTAVHKSPLHAQPQSQQQQQQSSPPSAPNVSAAGFSRRYTAPTLVGSHHHHHQSYLHQQQAHNIPSHNPHPSLHGSSIQQQRSQQQIFDSNQQQHQQQGAHNNSSNTAPLRSWQYRQIRREDGGQILTQQQTHLTVSTCAYPVNASISRSPSFASSVQANQAVDAESNVPMMASISEEESFLKQQQQQQQQQQPKDIANYRSPLPLIRSSTMPPARHQQAWDESSNCNNNFNSNNHNNDTTMSDSARRQATAKLQQELIDQWMHFE